VFGAWYSAGAKERRKCIKKNITTLLGKVATSSQSEMGEDGARVAC
jgi:hypothetical protein